MRIQHNIGAINTARQLSNNDNAISKNLQRLSSGYRINSAADDAAGLAISEKMRSQINGLNQAENNAEDGISLVKTGEGNLNETTSILQRMNELALESSNGTYQNGTDRTNLNKEVEALKTEINRISTSTNFNKINLLDGSLTNEGATVTDTSFYTFTNGAKGEKSTFTLDFTTVTANGATFTLGGTTYELTTDGNASTTANTAINMAATTFDADDVATKVAALTPTGYAAGTADGGKVTFSASANGTTAIPAATGVSVASSSIGAVDAKATFSIDFSGKSGRDLIGTTLNIEGKVYEFTTGTDVKGADTNIAVQITSGATAAAIASALNGKTVTASGYAQDAYQAGDTSINFTASANEKKAAAVDVRQGNAQGIVFQIGADNSSDQRVSLTVADMSAKGLGLDTLSISSATDAQSAVKLIQNAINTVSATRADFGALQNRLEHTVNNLSTTSENLTSAESRIRDVDMSSEMVEMTKNQILSQAATAMLAQANTQPQGVLQLLK